MIRLGLVGLLKRRLRHRSFPVNFTKFLFCRFIFDDCFWILSQIVVGRYHIETSPLICGANQWAGFYMITALQRDFFPFSLLAF